MLIKLIITQLILLFTLTACMVNNEDTLKHTPASETVEKQSKLNPLQDELLNANMYKLQEMLETYALDHKQTYPENIKVLYANATKKDKGYFKAIENPLTNLSWNTHNPEAKGIVYLIKQQTFTGGALVYEPVMDSQGKISRYRIWKTNLKGQLLPQPLKNYKLK